jgi:cbb3-type cytochrome oxidase cytochrome c subunit
MNQGPVIFLGIFFALVISWFGFIVQPQLQLGQATPSVDLYNPEASHPVQRAGLAQRGLDVYRSLGCATCHTQQMQQEGTVFDVILATPGTNVAEVIRAVLQVRPDLTAPEAARLVERTPVEILDNLESQRQVDRAVTLLSVADAQVETRLVPVGPDIARGWGVARSVGTDFLYDYPVMLGSQRIGPDLANVGAWPRTADWHFQHLYDPTSVIPGSVMPPYRFLFEKRRMGFLATDPRSPARPATGLDAIQGTRTNWVTPETLQTERESEVTPDYEIVPTDDARALVAYLMSLRADTPILERPLTGSAPKPDATIRAVGAGASAEPESPRP